MKPNAARIEVYVWYRVEPAHFDAARARASALLAALAPHCDQLPRLLQRQDDPTTWMEIYPGVADPAAFDAALAAACVSSGMTEARHVERFFAAEHA